MKAVIGFSMLLLMGCTETVTQTEYVMVRDTVTVVDTLILRPNPMAVVRTRVLRDGVNVRSLTITVTNIESGELLGTMLCPYPAFDDEYYRFVMPFVTPVFLFCQGGDFEGRSGFAVLREDFERGRFHNLDIWEATEREFTAQ